MTASTVVVAEGLVCWWVRVYTTSLPAEVRQARLAEIDSDLWEHQAAGVAIPVEYLAMSPYVITIVVLVILSADKSRAPGSLGRIFHATS